MALTLLQYEEIVTLLQRVPGLTDLLDDRSTVFADEVQRWLKDCENALEQNRIPSVSQVAAHRAVLIEATRGVRLKDVDFTGRPTPRKVRDATATMVLRETTELLNTVIAERQSVFAEAERLSRQAVSVARAKGMMADAVDPTSSPRRSGHCRNAWPRTRTWPAWPRTCSPSSARVTSSSSSTGHGRRWSHEPRTDLE